MWPIKNILLTKVTQFSNEWGEVLNLSKRIAISAYIVNILNITNSFLIVGAKNYYIPHREVGDDHPFLAKEFTKELLKSPPKNMQYFLTCFINFFLRNQCLQYPAKLVVYLYIKATYFKKCISIAFLRQTMWGFTLFCS